MYRPEETFQDCDKVRQIAGLGFLCEVWGFFATVLFSPPKQVFL